MPLQRNIRREILIGFFLALVTAALFWPVRTHEFINYDDQLYITKNGKVQSGLTWDNVGWAFGRLTGNGTYWHPLTWISHMLDCQLFKMDAGKHHLVSLLFHLGNTLLLFTLLRQMTNAVWRSAFVAALFAWHPLQVDTVAWVAERKNLLSTFFGLLTMLSYVHFTVKKCKVAYFLALIGFALTLMSKPFVTLPCVLLLLDVWPLQRVAGIRHRTAGQARELANPPLPVAALFKEKLPFFTLALASGFITILAHQKLDLMTDAAQFSFGSRLANATVSYLRYVGKTFWPDDLAVYYPLPEAWPAGTVLAATIFGVGLSAGAVGNLKHRPWLFTGWFWFLGTLVPFIGLLQVNDQAMADRFAYVPIIGLFLALVWGGAEIAERFSLGKNMKCAWAAGVLVAVAWAGRTQLQHWQNSETLFRHAIHVAESNIAHINYAAAIAEAGTKEKLLEAKAHYERAIAMVPGNSMAESNLGVTLAKLGQLNEAMPHFLKAVEINPDNADARSNLGLAYAFLNRPEAAIREYEAALRLQPDHPQARQNLENMRAQPHQ